MPEMSDSEYDLPVLRRALYHEPGFVRFEGFVPREEVALLQDVWTDKALSYHYHDFIPNKAVEPGTPDYLYNRPSPEDFAYCHHIWNPPRDVVLHGHAWRVQQLRNRLEGKPLYHGLHECTGQALQYRVCRTVSKGTVVKPHADFFDEYRHDPTGDHAFDPVRLQATLFLSDHGSDYTEGGFKLWDEGRQAYRVFGRDVAVAAGDLVLWRYSIRHEVSDVTALNHRIGFMRVIFPLFDIDAATERQG